MSAEAKSILVVDDTPLNVKLLADLLGVHGYRVRTAGSGEAALQAIAQGVPDLVLLDVMMPGMSGYEVCQRIRAHPDTQLLPVVMVTALDPAEERIKGIDAGADDFLSKPINLSELLARVRSLLRIAELHDTVRRQAALLAEWNEQLEARVQAQVQELRRLEHLKSFLPPEVVPLALADGGDALLRSQRREVTIAAVDMRGFTAFSEQAAPEVVIAVLSDYFKTLGSLAERHGGTVEKFAGDGMIVVFNAPVALEQAEVQALREALAMQEAFLALRAGWTQGGRELGLGIGVSSGPASLGVLGYEGHWQYSSIGTVTNLAARLCADATHGQVLATQGVVERAPGVGVVQALGARAYKGIRLPLAVFNVAAADAGQGA